jgi:hypothetical protein
VSFTFDAWTSESSHPYVSITTHYIDNPPNKPDKWELKEDQLAFAQLNGPHTGANIASVLNDTLHRYELHKKVRTFTMLHVHVVNST